MNKIQLFNNEVQLLDIYFMGPRIQLMTYFPCYWQFELTCSSVANILWHVDPLYSDSTVGRNSATLNRAVLMQEIKHRYSNKIKITFGDTSFQCFVTNLGFWNSACDTIICTIDTRPAFKNTFSNCSKHSLPPPLRHLCVR